MIRQQQITLGFDVYEPSCKNKWIQNYTQKIGDKK